MPELWSASVSLLFLPFASQWFVAVVHPHQTVRPISIKTRIPSFKMKQRYQKIMITPQPNFQRTYTKVTLNLLLQANQLLTPICQWPQPFSRPIVTLFSLFFLPRQQRLSLKAECKSKSGNPFCQIFFQNFLAHFARPKPHNPLIINHLHQPHPSSLTANGVQK